MKKLVIILFATMISSAAFGQKFAIKNNLLYDAALTPNLGFEMRLGKATSIDISGNWNPFSYKEGVHWKHWLVQPEFRIWTCETFNGFFFGAHIHGGEFNVSGFKLPFDLKPKDLKDYRYESWYYGAGLVVGYQWIISKRWSFEAAIGGGFARAHWDKYMCGDCEMGIDKGVDNYWGITKANLGLVFFW